MSAEPLPPTTNEAARLRLAGTNGDGRPRGGVYLLHFDQRYEHAGHYTGKPASSGLLKALWRIRGGEFAQLALLPMGWRHACGMAASWPPQQPVGLAKACWGPWPAPVETGHTLGRKLMTAGLQPPAAGAPPTPPHGPPVVEVGELGVVVAAAVVLGIVPVGTVVVAAATGAVVVGTAPGAVVVGADPDGAVVDVAGARDAGEAEPSALATTTPTEVLAPCCGRLPTKLASGCWATASTPVITPTASPNAATVTIATRRQCSGRGCALPAPSSLAAGPWPTRRSSERCARVWAEVSERAYRGSPKATRTLPSAAPRRVSPTPKKEATTAAVTAASAPASNLGTRSWSIPHLQVGVGGRRRCRGGPQARPGGGPAAPASAGILPTGAVWCQLARGRRATAQAGVASESSRPLKGPEGPRVCVRPQHVGPRRVHGSEWGCRVADRRAEILPGDQESCSSAGACRARWLSRDNAQAARSSPLTNSRLLQHHADDFGIRLGEQASGDGRAARLLQVIAQAGFGFRVARVWPGASKAYERSLKSSGGASRYCPICQVERTARGQLRRPSRGRGERDVGPSTRMPRADQQGDDGHRPGVGTAPSRGVRPGPVRQFLALNPAFARPAGASLAKQWGRVRDREEIEALGPRVTGARFEENQQLSQQRTAAITRRAVQARVQARQGQLADQAEQTRTRTVAARTHQRLANAGREHAGGRANTRGRSQPTSTPREGGHER